MKLKHALLGFLVSAGGFATAASIDLGNIEVEFSSPAGDPIAATIQVGWIDTGTADLTTLAGITAGFQSLGSFTANYGGVYDGVWAPTQVTHDNVNGGLNFNPTGLNVFVFATSGIDFGLVELTDVQFLDDNAVINAQAYDITSAKFGNATYTAHAGAFDGGGGSGAGGLADGYNLVAGIPEPSVAVLGALGVLGLLRRRRI